ncbi:hypothetical protein MBLNU230_g6975t1 [Neophaeotheca triangularis]
MPFDDEDDWYDGRHHKEAEQDLYEEADCYDAEADYDQRKDTLNRMMGNVGEAVESRQTENERIGDRDGRLEEHKERIAVLEADRDALRLERLHAAEEAAGRGSSAWDEERGDWGEFVEADYEAEGAEGGEGDSDSGSGSDMDVESGDEDERPRRVGSDARSDDEEVDMDVESDGGSDVEDED